MNKTAPLPRYLEIQQDLQACIASGEWGPGARVPPEHELQERYGCSRMTVNKALSALANAGLIVRRRRSGSFVAAPKSQQSILEIHDIQAEISASGRSYRFDILKRETRRATVEDANRLAIAEGAPVHAMQLLHYAAEKPFVLEERLLNLAVVAAAEDEAFHDSPPGTWLLHLVPWTDAEHVIRAELAGAVEARRLGVARPGALLIIERRTWQAGETITWVRLAYPGERHQLNSHFSPSSRLGG